ncbi:MAG: TetR/AcrR family transcriptional regulator [Coriobacteriia bacterium]|nr:TetR/AcrR family transcriptional regulator [Coriobacteriia bacterium]
MGVAFSESEIESIRAGLKARARECLTKSGVRKTSVADLVSAVGISAGALYRFYDSKEALFFEVFEDMDAEVARAGAAVLQERTDLSPRERVILALMTCFAKLEELGCMPVWEAESAYVLRKLPPEALADHQRSEGERIMELLSRHGIESTLPTADAAETLQRLLAAVSQPIAVDAERSRRVSGFMVRAVCEELFLDS